MPKWHIIFMVHCTIGTIKATTKMQVYNFILLLLHLLFCGNTMIFISMVIEQKMIFTCIIYTSVDYIIFNYEATNMTSCTGSSRSGTTIDSGTA